MKRFWAKVDTSGSCWLWKGARSGSGYGMVRGLDQRMIGAHVLSYQINRGPVPSGMSVLHTCDVKLCVRPDHLFLGTQKDNMQDMIRKGRAKRTGIPQQGEQNHGAKLTADIVRKIRQLAREGLPQRAIGRLLGVHHANVWCVLHGKSWTHVL